MKMLLTAVLKCERTDVDAQAVMDWFDEAAKAAGLPVEMAQVLPYDPPREPDPAVTEVAAPELPAPGPYGDGSNG